MNDYVQCERNNVLESILMLLFFLCYRIVNTIYKHRQTKTHTQIMEKIATKLYTPLKLFQHTNPVLSLYNGKKKRWEKRQLKKTVI